MIASAMRVLVVEDDPDDYLILQKLFERIPDRAFKLERAEDYDTGARALARLEHDIYIVDYRLGQHQGTELIHEARLLHCEAPIIMVTGDYDPDAGQAALVAGATDFVPKGELTPDILARLVRQALVRVAAQSELRRRSVQDELTQTFKHEHMRGLVQAEIRRSLRYQRGMGLLLLRIDGFDRICDEHGPIFGDQILRAVAQSCRYMLRLSDIVGRYADDGLCVLLPQTHIKGARGLAERMREAIANLRLEVADQPLAVSVSVGAAAWPDVQGLTLEAALDAAQQGLDAARAAGGNQVALAQAEGVANS